MARNLDKCQLVERSIHKTYRKTLWNPFIEGIKKYELIQENDVIAVCISGGKDSILLAKLMQELQKHSDFPFQLKFLVMDPGYTEKNLNKILSNAELLRIPVEVFTSDIFSVVDGQEKYPCYLCARMRRGYLYKYAKQMGCNKIALGHHFSDVVETTLMGMLWGGQIQGMLPKLHSKNFEGMELIRPMYCIHEKDIINWRDYNELSFLNCACKVTQKVEAQGCETSKRAETKALIKELKKSNPNVEKSIFNSIHNVCLDMMVGYKKNDVEYSFLDEY